MITKEKIEELEAYLRIFTHPQDRPMDATILELIAEWRARQEPAKTTGRLVAGFHAETSQVCTHCKMPIEAHHGEDLRCHLSAFHGVNTFQADPVKEPVCKHCNKSPGDHWFPRSSCEVGGLTTFEPLSQ